MWIFYVFCLLCLCERQFICALWSPAFKGLTSWLSFVVSYCEFVTFPLVSWVRCGTLLYRFLIFAPLLTFFDLAHHGSTFLLFWPGREKTCLRVFGKNKGADQPAHLRRLIIVFGFRLLKIIISKLATSEISSPALSEILNFGQVL